MKTKIALFLGLLLAANTCFAELKVGVVDMNTVLKEAPELKRLQTEFSSRVKQIKALETEIKGLEEKLNRDGAVMSESERTSMDKKLRDKSLDYKRVSEETGYDMNTRKNQELGKLQRRIVEAVQAIAKEQSFDLVLYEGVLFANDKLDITAQVQKKLSSAQ
ncbi:OmpH family outer membrane protein [Methylomicrobium lacus]|uniref:OmpH family outer membrane protein n=1 Tax=Methylomicrobium lacus TaxID=136992 RepID=UPI00045E6D34|nr:OmpH family outer membrane protein [Methylomicrobium lacus]